MQSPILFIVGLHNNNLSVDLASRIESVRDSLLNLWFISPIPDPSALVKPSTLFNIKSITARRILNDLNKNNSSLWSSRHPEST
jgi:hypothetical protein